MSSFCQITILHNLLLWNPWRKFPQKNKVNPQAEHFQLQVNFTNPILCLSFIGKNTNGGEIRQIPTMRPPTSYKWRAASLHVGGNVAQKIAMLPVRGGGRSSTSSWHLVISILGLIQQDGMCPGHPHACMSCLVVRRGPRRHQRRWRELSL